jgi:hypothetical protein
VVRLFLGSLNRIEKMARRTAQSDGEYIWAFYGINRKTFEVESVWQTRGGMLSYSNRNGHSYSHHIAKGRDAKSEVIIVFELTDIFEVPIALVGTEHTKLRIKELEDKASAMKAVAEKEKS